MSNETKEEQSETLHFLDYWRVIRSRKEIVIAVAVLIIVAGTAYTLMLPSIYESASRISVSEDTPQINPFAAQQYQGVGYNPYFLKTQFEILQSKPRLYEVIKRLDLQKVWGKKKGEPIELDIAYNILKKSITVFQQRDTSLIVIAVRRDDPNEAAKIANQLATVYREYRLDIAQKHSTRAINKIREELKKQKVLVRQAEKKVEKLRVDLDIALVGGEGVSKVEDLRLQQLEGERVAAQREMLEKQGAIKLLKNIDEKELMEIAPYLTTDPQVLNTMQQIQDLDVQLSSLEESFGSRHPDVLAAKSQIAKLKKKLKSHLKGLRNGLKAEYLKAKNKYMALDVILKDVRKKNIELNGKIRPFKNAQTDLEAVEYVYTQLNAKLQEEIITLQIPKNPVEIIEDARPDPRRVSPNLFLNVLLSIFVGLGAGVGLAYFIEYLDTSVKTADDIERILGLPVLGLIPQKVRPLIEEGPDSEHGEAYRVLRTNMAFSDSGSHHGAFCVLSSGAGEGKSTTVFNLAYVCAQQGEKVLLVDADLRRPVQHSILGVSNRFGLTNVLLRDVPVEEAIKATSVPNLHFLPSGRLPRTSLGIIDPKRIGELIKSLKTKYDIVLIDTPPLIGISDSSIIAKEADGAILVVQYRKYPREMLQKAKQTMDTLGVSVIGAVLNNINVMRDDYYYYYSQSTDYYNDLQEEG